MRRVFVMTAAVALLAVASRAQAEDKKVDFAKQIAPILKESCYSCHGAKKKKGGLRLHTAAEITKGEILVAGKPKESELFVRITLPNDDDDRMPPEGDPLSKEQIALVKLWIEQGGSLEGAVAEVVRPKKNEKPNVPPADAGAIEELRKLGALVLPLSQKTNRLLVDFRSKAKDTGDAQIAALKKVSAQVTWLNLARSKVSDAGLAQLAELKELERLHLELTGVSDAGVKHLASLSNLEYLNLYGTQVGDAGIDQLKGLGKLKKLFLWQSKASYEGSVKLRKAIPGLKVNLGWDNPGMRKEKAQAKLVAAKKALEEAAKE
ncbi:MAG: c-type cytochrome domain-containing protein [Planctomycetota bacterium]